MIWLWGNLREKLFKLSSLDSIRYKRVNLWRPQTVKQHITHSRPSSCNCFIRSKSSVVLPSLYTNLLFYPLLPFPAVDTPLSTY